MFKKKSYPSELKAFIASCDCACRTLGLRYRAGRRSYVIAVPEPLSGNHSRISRMLVYQ